MDEKQDIVKKLFRCNECEATHEIVLNRSILVGKLIFPFSYIYLHGELKDILTILYLDSDLEIRGVETHLLSRENIFSKEHMTEIINKMITEIETLRSDYNFIYEKYQKLKNSTNEGGFLDLIKNVGEGVSEFIKALFNPKSEEVDGFPQ